jgi:signal transduction histidine kinase
LTLAFAYILLTIVIALSIPLAINLGERARSEYATDVLSSVQTIASAIGGTRLQPNERDILMGEVDSYSRQLRGRVVVTDERGTVLADSDRSDLGENYLNGQRPEIDIALRRQQPNWQFRYSADERTDILVTAAPILDDGIVGAVRLTANAQDVNDAVRATQVGIAVIGVAGIFIGVLIAAGLAGSLARPLQRLAGVARRLGRGDLAARAGEVNGGREVVDLAQSFDEMADRLQRTVHAQREFVANASHQLRTPLTGMKLRLESAIAGAPSADVRHQLEAADREVDRLSQIVDRLLTMARDIEQGTPTHVELADAAHRATERWQDRAQQLNARISTMGNAVTAQANPTDVDQILDNLIDNAIAYAPGPIEIETGSANGRAYLSVQDHGIGIPADEQERVTERFYRGRVAPSGGSGLGLAIARELAEKWGGSLDVSTGPEGGALAHVRFRIATDPITVDERASKT